MEMRLGEMPCPVASWVFDALRGAGAGVMTEVRHNSRALFLFLKGCFSISAFHAVPLGPEIGRLPGVRDDFQEEGCGAVLELVEIIGAADAEVSHAPERGQS